MSTDTIKPQHTEIRADRRTTAQLLSAAQRDTDPVSVFGDGTCPADTNCAIFVVKGREHIEYLTALLQRQGLLTAGKAVTS